MELLEFLTHLVQAVCAREAKETYGERNSGEPGVRPCNVPAERVRGLIYRVASKLSTLRRV